VRSQSLRALRHLTQKPGPLPGAEPCLGLAMGRRLPARFGAAGVPRPGNCWGCRSRCIMLGSKTANCQVVRESPRPELRGYPGAAASRAALMLGASSCKQGQTSTHQGGLKTSPAPGKRLAAADVREVGRWRTRASFRLRPSFRSIVPRLS